jgi:ABC-type uncharacterized transport system involved in gliding motility auxiliary subunit
MKRKLLSGTGLIIIVALVLGANLIGALLFRRVKFDVTNERLYTLSKGSAKIVKSLQEPIRAEVYFSKTALANVPVLKAYGDRVVEMLREYRELSGGKLKVEVIDPRPDTEEEETAESYGVQGIVPDPRSGERVYLGVVFKDESDNRQVIRFLDPGNEDTLEYEMSKAIYGISHPERKKIGVLSGLDIMGAPRMPFAQQSQPAKSWAFIRDLKNSFQVTTVDPAATEIPKDLDLLLVVHPKDFSKQALYAIDQYVLGGGKLAMFIDPFCEEEARSSRTDNFQMRMQQTFSSNAVELLRAWGVEMRTTEPGGSAMGMSAGPSPGIAADPNLAVKVNTPRSGLQDYVLWLNLTKANHNAEEIATSKLESVMMASAGALKKIGSDPNIQIAPLLSTTEKANLVSDMALRFGSADPRQLLQDFKPGNAKLDLALKITGKFKTAFPEGKPPATASDKDKPAQEPTKDSRQLMASKQPTTIILVADVDMLSDYFSVQTRNFFGQELTVPINDNQNFVANVAENLSGSQDLIALRTRGRSQRRFAKIDEIEKAARDKWQARQRELNEKLAEANRRLSELQQGSDKERRILDQAFMAEVEKFRQEKIETGKALREVNRRLREDIERLEFRIVFINIVLVPLAVALVGVFIAIRKTFFRSEG